MEKKKNSLGFEIREPANFYTHAIPAVLFIPAIGYLLASADTDMKYYASIIYGVAFILMFTSSALYHSVPKNADEKKQWRKLDHASIYLMIAGSYTPLLLLLKGDFLLLFFCIVWGIAIFGISSKLSGKLTNHKLSLSLYLVMGWMMVFIIKPIYQQLSLEAIAWLFAGGLFYSVGSYFYNRDKKFPNIGLHAVWHLFVVAGAACHFYFTLFFLIK